MQQFRWSLGVFFALCLTSFADESRMDLRLVLGERNEGVGLRVPSGGDGENVSEIVQGVAARRVAGGRAHYLYVVIDHPAYQQGPVDFYVSAEVFDDRMARVSVHYDQMAVHPDSSMRYTLAEPTYMLFGTGKWRTLTFRLHQLRLGHGQNFGADLEGEKMTV